MSKKGLFKYTGIRRSKLANFPNKCPISRGKTRIFFLSEHIKIEPILKLQLKLSIQTPAEINIQALLLCTRMIYCVKIY